MTTTTTTRQVARGSERRNLVRHFFEMVLAMVVGMVVLGMVTRMICAALGNSEFFVDHPGLRAPLMTLNMTVAMALWMRHRGHGWGATAEMSAAMFVPLAVLIGPFLVGAISGNVLLGAMHLLMIPAMVIAMLHRRDEYAHDHRRHVTNPARLAA
jgi:flagellar biosynthetic protein FliP